MSKLMAGDNWYLQAFREPRYWYLQMMSWLNWSLVEISLLG
ncbi:hypothetical protein [Acinetobacter sp. WC-323]|nr:hypothetical protein [Acinetobacter sp. WC-323]